MLQSQLCLRIPFPEAVPEVKTHTFPAPVEDVHCGAYEELGTVHSFKAKVSIPSEAKSKFCKAWPVPYALREAVGEELDHFEVPFLHLWSQVHLDDGASHNPGSPPHCDSIYFLKLVFGMKSVFQREKVTNGL